MASVPTRKFASAIRAKAFTFDGIKSITATAAATRANNAGRTNVLNAAAGLTVTLPATSADTIGHVYKFVVGTVLTSNDYIIKVANATDVFKGGIFINNIGDTTAATVDFWETAGTSDTLTIPSATGGGKIGDWVEFECIASGSYVVRGTLQGVTDPATPFSATVS